MSKLILQSFAKIIWFWCISMINKELSFWGIVTKSAMDDIFKIQNKLRDWIWEQHKGHATLFYSVSVSGHHSLIILRCE
jgi:hypothetical protein